MIQAPEGKVQCRTDAGLRKRQKRRKRTVSVLRLDMLTGASRRLCEQFVRISTRSCLIDVDLAFRHRLFNQRHRDRKLQVYDASLRADFQFFEQLHGLLFRSGRPF